jgi:hypothetical protein
MRVRAIVCPACGTAIYSVANHDYNTCDCSYPCGIAVDGGHIDKDGTLSFRKMAYGTEINVDDIKEVEINVDASPAELYKDWNASLKTPRKFGRIVGYK